MHISQIDTSSFVDITPRWANVAFVPSKPEKKLSFSQTGFITSDDSLNLFFNFTEFSKPTPVSNDLPDISTAVTPINEESSATLPAIEKVAIDTEIDAIAKQRVQLLAAKYAGGQEHSEIMARLEILNTKLLERSPRVSVDQVKALEVANECLESIRRAREERAKRFGLSV